MYGAYGTDTGNESKITSADFTGFNMDQQAATVLVLAAFSNVANLSFEKVEPANGAGTLRFNFTGAPAIGGTSYAFSGFP